MLRTKFALTMAGVATAAGVAGCALGLMVAPASGRELRRRLVWRAEERWQSAARSCERMLERAVVRAREELQNRKKRLAEALAAKAC